MLLKVNNAMRNFKIYDGVSSKFGITYNGVDYIVKSSKEPLGVYCEYVASSFISDLGIPCHQVYLGIYNNDLAAVLKDFTVGSGYTLQSYKDIGQSVIDTDESVKECVYDDVEYLIDKHLKLSCQDKQAAKEQLWDMFICDAILGNGDRHSGNWGYLAKKESYKTAPLYDNGSSLFPGISKVIDQYIDKATRSDFLKDRVYKFPASLFKIKRDNRESKTGFYEMFSDLRVNKIFAQRVKLFRSKHTPERIFRIMHNICYSPDLADLDHCYKRFFCEITALRYMVIVCRMNFDKAYKMVEEWLNDGS